MNFTRDFKGDLDVLIEAFRARKPFGFARFGPSECFMADFRPVRATGSHWRHPGGRTGYTTGMEAAMRYKGKGYFVGMPCPCCNPVQARKSSPRFRVRTDHATFHTLFMNANWPRALDWFRSVRESCVLVGPTPQCDIVIPSKCADAEWDYKPLVAKIARSRKPVLLAAGPVANLVIFELRKYTVPVVDIGSLADTILFGKPTRAYQRGPDFEYTNDENGRLKRERTLRMTGRVCRWKIAEKAIHANK